MMDLDQNLFPSTASLVLLSVSMDNNYVIQYRCWCHDQCPYPLRGKGGGVFIKELHNSHVGRACSDCNGSTICIYHEQKTSAWQWCSVDTYSHGYNFYTSWKEATPTQWHSYGRDGQVLVVKNSSQRSWATRCRIDKDSESTSNAAIISKKWYNAFAGELCIFFS